MIKKASSLIVSMLIANLLMSCAAVVVGGVAATATSGAAVATDPRSSSGVFDDQGLKKKVNNSLNAMIPGNNIEVTSYAQNILLTGQVIDEQNRKKAEIVTKQVVGVKKIYNYIQVGPSQSAGQTSKDAYLTSVVKSNLLISKGVSSNDVKVVTSNSVVYLMGMVDEYQAKKMEHAAREVDGVKEVEALFEYEKPKTNK